MKIRLTSRNIAAFLLFLVAIPGSFAIDTRNAWRILDNFKERHEEILFESLPFTETGANDAMIHEYTMNGLSALKSKIDTIERAYIMKKELIEQKRFDLEEALRILDASILESEENIKANEDIVTLKTRYLADLETQSLDLKRKIAQYRATILEYIAHIYSEGNKIYFGEEIDVIKTLVLSPENTDFILADISYKWLVSELGQSFVEEYRTGIKDYYILSLQIEEEIINLREIKETLKESKRLLVEQKKQREKLLEITKWQQKLFESYILAQQDAQESVENAWKEAEGKYRETLDKTLRKYGCGDEKITEASAIACHHARLYFANEKKLQSSILPTNTANIMMWPTNSREISTYFRDPGYYAYLGSQHDAIDIAVDQGSPVFSAAPGYVYYVMEPTSWGYSYLAIKHRDGFVTVYGHLSEIIATEWQFVEAGELIAKSWGTPGTPWAGPMTTWPHLHFEVWKDKEVVDPLRYLTLAQVLFESLPSRYQEKFMTDIVEYTGDTNAAWAYKKSFSIKGRNEKQRQEYLLLTYATPDFQDWSTWIESAMTQKIDPSFLMCVWLAETTLGNHLKTAYNIGNVGNTDSGGTYEFSSPQEGIEWMAKTFNNKFLSKYTKVSELSRWGNDEGNIYASSSANWHNNIIKCVSALKWRFIEDTYEFRLKD